VPRICALTAWQMPNRAIRTAICYAGFPGAHGTPDCQTLGGLRKPLPSKEGHVGCAVKAKRTIWTVHWNTELATDVRTAAATDKQGNAIGQFGIVAQLCDVQGVPSSICIIGEVPAATAAKESCAGATIIVASDRSSPKMPNSLFILTSVPGSARSHNTQFAEQ
jgi:hypothetical protein